MIDLPAQRFRAGKLRLHAVRSALYAPVFLSFAWLEPAVGSRKDSLRC
jgi:hypothetical protein